MAQKINIIGLGYVGLPLAISLSKAGFFVQGFDTDKSRVENLSAGKSPIEDISSKELSQMLEIGNLIISTTLVSAPYHVICVPTPIDKKNRPDLSHIISAADSVQKILLKGDTVILESSTYPGTTEDIVIPILEKNGLLAGTDFFVGYAPERIDPGNSTPYKEISRIVSGINSESLSRITYLYSFVCDNLSIVSNVKTAETAKLLENTFRLVNISLINEITKFCSKLEIDIHEVIDAAATKPYGYMPFYPSIGAGGHCIPVDPAYLVHAMDECGENTNYISEALKINLNMKNWVLEKMAKHMSVQPSNFQNKKILFLGVAYKSGISDLRHSSAIELIKILEKNNANVDFWDEKVSFIKIDDSSTKYKFDFKDRSLIDFDLIFINYLNEFPLKEDLKNTKAKIFDAQLNPLKLNTLNYTKI